MSFLKIPFALSLTGRGCQRTLWSADTTLLGFGGILLIETAKKPLLIIAPKLSFRIIPGLETWGGGSRSAESFLLWSSWARTGVPEQSVHRRIREAGTGIRLSPWLPPTAVGVAFIHFSAWEISEQGRMNLPSPDVRPHHKDTCWTVSKNGTPFGRAKKTTH